MVEAGSGEEALNALRKQNFDLVITDQVMPKMTGVELMQAVEREWPQMPVILATGYAELPQSARLKTPMRLKVSRALLGLYFFAGVAVVCVAGWLLLLQPKDTGPEIFPSLETSAVMEAPSGHDIWRMFLDQRELKPSRRKTRKAQQQHFARRDQSDARADQHVTEEMRRQQRACHRQDSRNGKPDRPAPLQKRSAL